MNLPGVKLIFFSMLFVNALLLILINPPITDILMHPPQSHYTKSTEWELYQSSIKHGSHIQKVLNDDDYCERVEAFRKFTPISLDSNGLPSIQQRVVYSNYPNWYFVKKILANNTNLVLEEYVDSSTKLNKVHLVENITLFFHMTTEYHEGKQIDTQFLCKGQRYNHIPGNIYIDSKDTNALDIYEYKNIYRNNPECAIDFFPNTLVLDNISDCQIFIKDLQSNNSIQKIKWIYKKARKSNQGRGVFLVDTDLSKKLIGIYDESSECERGYIAQEYIGNPFLINSHKFDFRAYMVIASMSPLIVLYHDGFLRLTAAEFVAESTDAWRHITNIRQAKIFLETHNISETERKDIVDSLDMTNLEFLEYLNANHFYSGDWLSEVFRPRVKEIILHVVRMNSKRLVKHPRVFEIFGIDFMMDKDMKIWLIEINTDPGIAEITKDMGDINIKFLLDLIELEYSLEYNPQIFDELLSRTNFQFVYDERKFGISRYHGLIKYSCI